MDTAEKAGAAAPRVDMQGIVKRFGDLVALGGVDLTLVPGEVHALLGENGAGKSTLMNHLCGVLQPDGGQILLDGHVTVVHSPAQAARLGIGMVHQQYRLVADLTVAENLNLGWADAPALVGRSTLERRAAALEEQFGLQISPRAHIRDLSIGEQQRVAIMRTLARGARVLILDEPTAVLTPMEVDTLFRSVRSLADEGRTVVFISHKLKEVMAVSDQVTILRRGRVADTKPTSSCNERTLALKMVGSEVVLRVERQPRQGGAPLLEALGIDVENDCGQLAVRDFSLRVREGEIVGVAGVAGNGQPELVEALTGMRSVRRGEVRVGGRAIAARPSAFFDAGVGHVPEDRDNVGLVLAESIELNAILKVFRHPPIARRGIVRRREARQYVSKVVEAAQLTTGDSSTPVRHLSGGNRQRLLVARELRCASRVLVASHPTVGIDIAATKMIWEALVAARSAGAGILLISEDLDEVLALSDRVLVIYEGTNVGEFQGDEIDRQQIGLLMGGRVGTAAGLV